MPVDIGRFEPHILRHVTFSYAECAWWTHPKLPFWVYCLIHGGNVCRSNQLQQTIEATCVDSRCENVEIMAQIHEKYNEGRAAAPSKRVGLVLVELGIQTFTVFLPHTLNTRAIKQQ